MKLFKQIVFLIVAFSAVYAGDKPRRYANAFLEIPVGARASAMGGAYSAVANDATAFFWNPAGVSLTNRYEVAGMFSSQFGGLAQYNFLGYNHQVSEKYSFAVAWIRYDISNIPENSSLTDTYSDRGVPGYDFGQFQHGRFSYADNAVFFSFARMNKLTLNMGWSYSEFPMQIPIGVNFKVIRGGTSGISGDNGRIMKDVRKSGIGVDVGTMIMFGLNDLLETPYLGDFVMALNIQDATTTAVEYNKLSSSVHAQDIVPANFKFGMSYIQGIDEIQSNLLLSYESNSRYKNDRHFGMEWQYRQAASLRFGLDRGTLTYGAGFSYQRLQLDYALNSHPLGYTNRISMSYKF